MVFPQAHGDEMKDSEVDCPYNCYGS